MMADQPAIFPFLRYDDPDAAIAFLTAAFGFEEHAVHRDDRGMIVHAELRYGASILMFGSIRNLSDASAGRMEAGGRFGLYLAVDDPDAHHARATGAGAVLVEPPRDQDYGSREYSARDPEGKVWSFGTYRPGSGTTETA
jgi:uncharacterized glyoxalase superfamily protein PhnB